jgi:hypothetical protein
MRVACWLSKITGAQAHAHSFAHSLKHAIMHTDTRMLSHAVGYVLLIAFPRSQWFRECASILRIRTLTGLFLNVFMAYLSTRLYVINTTRHNRTQTSNFDKTEVSEKFSSSLTLKLFFKKISFLVTYVAGMMTT